MIISCLASPGGRAFLLLIMYILFLCVISFGNNIRRSALPCPSSCAASFSDGFHYPIAYLVAPPPPRSSACPALHSNSLITHSLLFVLRLRILAPSPFHHWLPEFEFCFWESWCGAVWRCAALEIRSNGHVCQQEKRATVLVVAVSVWVCGRTGAGWGFVFMATCERRVSTIKQTTDQQQKHSKNQSKNWTIHTTYYNTL